jgi:hypothetical protein
MDVFFLQIKDRMMGPRCWISLVLLAGLLLTLLSSQPFLRIAAGAESRLLSLDARGETLGELLRKISKDTGYLISFDSEWAGLPVSVSFRNLTVAQGLRRVLAKLNHSIVFNDAGRRIAIVIKSFNNGGEFPSEAVLKAVNNDPPGALQSTKASLETIKDPVEIQVIPPEKPRTHGTTRKELEEIEARRPMIDPDHIEVLPPSGGGEKGVTVKEIKVGQKVKNLAALKDGNLVPPDGIRPK